MQQVRSAARADKTIVVGPWLSEVGFEVLYWLPFLAWITERYRVEPDRIVAVSRGGAGAWYEGLAGTYLDVFERWGPADLKQAQHDRARSGRQKQLAVTPGERALIDDLLETHGIDPRGTALLHPSALYLAFKGFWEGWRPMSDVTRRTVNRPLPIPPRDPGLGLPDDYVAVKLYFSDCFPDTPTNRAAAIELVREVSEVCDVVLLTTGLDVDDHTELADVDAGRLHDLSARMRPDTNLAVQTQAIAGARTFVGTYGGFSYLAPFLGVPAISVYTERNFIEGHLDVMRQALPFLRSKRRRADFAVRDLREGVDFAGAVSAGGAG